MVQGSARFASTSLRHIGLMARVIAASSSCAVSFVIDAEIGMMPSTVAINTSPPIGVWQFMPSGVEVAYRARWCGGGVSPSLPPVVGGRGFGAGEDQQLALIGHENTLVVDAVAG